MGLIYLAEAEAHTGTGLVTHRWSSGRGYAAPDAPGYYEPRILQPANLRRTAFGEGTTTGAVEAGFGEMVLANIDGGLDALVDHGFDGRALRILIGDEDAPYSAFTVLFQGTIEQPAFTLNEVSFRLRDRLFEFDQPAQATKFAGTDNGATGLEGGTDLKGRPKPRVYGTVRNVAPPYANTSLLVLQINDGAVFDVPAVYDNGVALTKGADYADQAAMLATAPTAGQYRVWKAGGMFRLGSSPAGVVTADVVQGATAADRTAAQILRALATGPGGIPAADVVAADVAALDVANSAELGIWIDDEVTVLETMEQVSNAVGAWFGFDRLGRLRMRRLSAPSGTPAATLQRLWSGEVADAQPADIVELERIPTRDEGRGVPAYRVRLGYQRNWTVQTNGIAGSVTPARREFLAAEYRRVTATDTAVQTKHRLAKELAFESLLDTEAAAQAEAARRLALYGVRRDRLRARVKFDAGLAATVDLGSVVRVRLPRFGYGAGKLFEVIGIEYDAARDVADLELWG
ncbi:MAG TPA: hypothetical protein VEY95_01150 [Azospirillaceae bacterium]|nr:hypothetical protein [Azospirillaceae bacterium]